MQPTTTPTPRHRHHHTTPEEATTAAAALAALYERATAYHNKTFDEAGSAFTDVARLLAHHVSFVRSEAGARERLYALLVSLTCSQHSAYTPAAKHVYAGYRRTLLAMPREWLTAPAWLMEADEN